MLINTESINAFQTLVTDPKKYNLKFRPITDCFEKAEQVTAKHILAKQYMVYMTYMGADMPKLVCYIVMDNIFGLCDGTDTEGLLGYHLKFKQ